MMRREFITLLGGAPAWPLVARAQQSSSAVIGFLSTLTPEGFSEPMRGFRQGLRESGYIEAENLRIEWAENQTDRLPALAADLVKRQVEVGGLMSYGTNLTEAYRQMAPMLAVFSEAPNPQSRSYGASSSSLSTLRPQGCSALPSHRRCSRPLTR
jgi:putative tryptophan/tyrosine transport system substrate-binding protein